jgi:site-specific DNA-methyltransferase (adenine-specific)
MSNIKQYKYDWVWDKIWVTNPMMAKKQPMRCSENILVFYDKQCQYNPQMRIWKKWSRWWKKEHSTWTLWESVLFNKWSDVSETKYPKNIIEFSNADKTKNIHPTQKPVALIEYLIKTYSLENDIILDFTSGSWTTWIAAQNTNRNYILIEKDEWYYNISKERLVKNKILLWSI